MSDADELVELSHEELVLALVIILRSNTAAIPIMRGKGSTRDTSIRDAQTLQFAEHLATKLRQYARCFKPVRQQLHSFP